MTLWKRLKLAAIGLRSWRKGNKMATEVLKSKTTQNSVIGVGGVAGTVAAIIVFLRSMKPEWVPWGTDGDAAIVAVIATVIGPLVSRAVAFKRNPEKKPAAALPAGVELLAVARIQLADGNNWEEFRDSFQAAVNAGATLIHCENENVYRPNGELVGHMPLPPRR